MTICSAATDLLGALVPEWHLLLQGWSASGRLTAAAQEALMLNGEPQALTDLTSQWSAGEFRGLPPIVLLSAADINGALGAYAISTGTIYLNADWLAGATKEQVLAVLTEELGHYLDKHLNATDTRGDEGDLFSRILGGDALRYDEVQAIRSENDAVVLTLANGSQVRAEAATLIGTEGDDPITGTDSADTINGRGGNDTIDGRGGNDTVDGGAGNDTIGGGDGNDSITGNSGVDYIYGDNGDDTFTSLNADNAYGGSGNDSFYGGAPVGTLDGGDGNDYFEGTFIDGDSTWSYEGISLTCQFLGGAGDDTLNLREGVYVSTSDIIVDGGTGYDILKYATGYSGWMGDTNGKHDYILNTRNFEKIEFYEANVMWVGNSALTDAVINDGLDFEFRIERGYSEIDASAETGSKLTFRMVSAAVAYGGTKNDSFYGNGEGADTFKGNGGNDYFDGSDGIDIGIFSGNSSDYTITQITYNTFEVKDNRAGSPDGTDTIVDVNKLRFADKEQDVVISAPPPVNSAPTDLTLTSSGVQENSAAGTIIGTLGATDPDAASTFTYALVAGNGTNDADNALVEIVGNEVKVKSGASIDFETNPVLNLNIQVTDNGGLTFTKAVTASVLDVVETPSDTTPPTISSIGNQGTTVILKFSENVSASGVLPSSLVVATLDSRNQTTNRTISTISLDQNDSTQIILTLQGSAPASTVNLRVSYTDPANDQTSGVIQDLAGNDLASFSNRFADTFITGSTTTLASQYRNLTLTGTANVNGTGNALANIITGNSGNNTLSGLAGIDDLKGDAGNDIVIGGASGDLLTGGTGSDTFRFALTDSLLASMDRITDLVIGTDTIDGPRAVTAANLRELGTVTALTQAGIAAVLTTANFVANGAATFSFGTGATARTFLALNNGTAGFSSTTDAIIEITGATGALTNLAVV